MSGQDISRRQALALLGAGAGIALSAVRSANVPGSKAST